MTDDKRKQLETYETALLTEMNQHAQIQQGQSRDPKACKRLNFASEKQKNLQCEKGSPSKRLRMEEDRADQTNPTEEPSTEEQASGLSTTSPGEPAPEQHREQPAISSTPLNSPMRGSVVVNVPPSPVVIAPCSSNIVRRLDALLECVNKIADKLSEKQAVDKEPTATCITTKSCHRTCPRVDATDIYRC
ncbi:uncharacterized protein [Ptychodera flava]|uniref:uncharacterized protein isoform X2 n=1 Tax=Ptychodera flava TaxID=63121 RepID=UPI00396A37C7